MDALVVAVVEQRKLQLGRVQVGQRLPLELERNSWGSSVRRRPGTTHANSPSRNKNKATKVKKAALRALSRYLFPDDVATVMAMISYSGCMNRRVFSFLYKNQWDRPMHFGGGVLVCV